MTSVIAVPVQGTYLDADAVVYNKLYPDPDDPQAAHLNISLVTGKVIVSLLTRCHCCALLPWMLDFLLLVREWPVDMALQHSQTKHL